MLALAMALQPGADVIVLPDAGRSDRTSDAELVRRGRGGDGWAHEMIFRRYAAMIGATARRLLRDASDVDDVVQETFLIAFEKLDRLSEPAALRGWLAQIAVSRVHRRFRWRRVTKLLGGDDGSACLEDQASASASPEHRAELALIDRALHKLAPKLRTPWVMRHVVGLGLDDIAMACECSLATVKRRIQEADEAVSEYLALDAPARATTDGGAP